MYKALYQNIRKSANKFQGFGTYIVVRITIRYRTILMWSKCAALDTPCATRVSVHAKNRTLARNVEKISLVCSREISGMQGPHLLSIAPTRLTYTRTRSQACCAPRATSSRIPFPSKVHTNGICCTPVLTYVGIITIY